MGKKKKKKDKTNMVKRFCSSLVTAFCTVGNLFNMELVQFVGNNCNILLEV